MRIQGVNVCGRIRGAWHTANASFLLAVILSVCVFFFLVLSGGPLSRNVECKSGGFGH